jgi:tetratricopeptide (TPR) repeat protein
MKQRITFNYFILAFLLGFGGCATPWGQQAAVEESIQLLSVGGYTGIIRRFGKSPHSIWRHPVIGYLLSMAYIYAPDRDQWANPSDREKIGKYFRMSPRGDSWDKYWRRDSEVIHVELTLDILSYNNPDNPYYKFALAGIYDCMQRSERSKDKKNELARLSLKNLDEALKIIPDEESFLLLGAVVAANSGDFKLTEKYYRRIKRPLPRSIMSVGAHYFDNGFYKEAMEVFQDLIKKHPDYKGIHRPYLFMAQISGKMGKPDDVIEYARKYLSYGKGDKGAAYQLMAAALEGKGEIVEPIKLYKKAVREARKQPPRYRDLRLNQYYRRLEVLHLRMRQYSKAWKSARKRPPKSKLIPDEPPGSDSGS